MSVFENCIFSLKDYNPSWQYGQEFVNIGDQPCIFLVEPFQTSPQPILHGPNRQQQTRVFHKWLRLVNVVKNGVEIEQNSPIRINQWKMERNWNSMVQTPDYYHMTVQNDIDPMTGIIMTDNNSTGFKYRVTYQPGPHWTCTCTHFKTYNNACCKHINACIDTSIDPQHFSWLKQSCQFVFKDRIRQYPGLNDIVTKITPASATASATAGTTSKKMVPSFKQWSTRSI